MFHRILVDEWQRGLTIASFTIFLCVFLITLCRVFRMSRGDIRKLEELPFQNEAGQSHE